MNPPLSPNHHDHPSPQLSPQAALQQLHADRPVLITGGAGFIGTNVADRFLSAGQSVLLYDNLSRPGVEAHVHWLRQRHGKLIDLIPADVRDPTTLRAAVACASRVFHFAAQVAVTTSLNDPVQDFEVNARGTLNLLETLRAMPTPPPLLFTSTNKVYGSLPDVPLSVRDSAYSPDRPDLRTHGVNEQRPLDFHSPYGCSKGTADQYVLDYAHTCKLPTIVFRMSCIYGQHQLGTEDQGWVAHFLLRAQQRKPITLYGDGRQVRDILHIDDLVDAMLLAHAHIGAIAGQAFNVGGGPSHAISLLDLLNLIESLTGSRPATEHAAWRCGDQRYYVSDIRKLTRSTGWSPQITPQMGITRLWHWLTEHATSPDRTPARNGGTAATAWLSHHARTEHESTGHRSIDHTVPAAEADHARRRRHRATPH